MNRAAIAFVIIGVAFSAGCASMKSESVGEFEKIAEGMTMAEVVELLGEPSGTLDDRPVWERNGFMIVAWFSDDGILTLKQHMEIK